MCFSFDLLNIVFPKVILLVMPDRVIDRVQLLSRCQINIDIDCQIVLPPGRGHLIYSGRQVDLVNINISHCALFLP